MSRRGEGSLLLALMVFAGALLEVVPLPPTLEPLRPYWVALVLIYWALEEQGSVSLGGAFLVGVFLDLLTGSLLGLHALSLVIMIYLVQRFRSRLRFFPPWQQALAVLALLLNDRVILLWIARLAGEPMPTWQFWLPPLTGTILWPWLFLAFDRLRASRRYRQLP